MDCTYFCLRRVVIFSGSDRDRGAQHMFINPICVSAFATRNNRRTNQ
jgi:hypothetical protein